VTPRRTIRGVSHATNAAFNKVGSVVLGGVAACRLSAMKAGSLGLSVEEFRVLAGRVVEGAAGYLDRLDGVPIRPGSTGAQTVRCSVGHYGRRGLERRHWMT
jgi:hypothetical protein